MRRRILPLAAAAVLLCAVTAPAAPSYSHVTFTATDAVTLRGHLWARGKTAVVFSHMLGTDQSIWFDLAGRLAAQGYTVLTFDFRGVGTSSGRFVIRRVSRDTLGAVRFIRGRNPAKVVLIGASMGGTSSLVAAGETPVDGVVVIASGMAFQGLDARPYLPRLRMPKLFIVGRRDAPFNESAKTMYGRTPRPKQLLEVPTAVHGTYMFRTKHKATIYRGIIEFLTEVSKHKQPE
ncbi:MAG TPA: alpha/beta fold hydrolase [bacterium]|nr:alpha/beta fold hydrolase [bacterium]